MTEPPAGFRGFLAARFDRESYLGLHLTVGLALTILGLWLFATLTEDIINAEAMTKLDLRVNTWMQTNATVTGDGVFGVITQLGAPVSLAIIGLAGAIIFWRLHRRAVLIGWIGAFGGGAVLDAVLKVIIHRPRPPQAMDYLVHMSWSYPSGHSMMSLVCFGMVAYALCVMRFKTTMPRVVIVAFAAIMTVLVGASRIYLGVHYLGDVIAGFVAGIVWLSMCISGLEIIRRRPIPLRRSA